MIALYILGALIGIVLLVLFVNVNLIFTLSETSSVKLRILFFKFDAVKLVEKLYAQNGDSQKEVPEEPEEKEEKKKVPLTPERIVYLIERLIEIIKAVTREICTYVRVKICHIRVRVSCEDAADTAKYYGIVSGAVWGLIGFLSHNMRVKRCDKNISVYPDFVNSGSKIDLKIVLRIRPINVLSAIMHLLPVFAKKKGRKK